MVQYTTNNKNKKRWHKVLIALATVVVFFTTYAMILPAITLDKTTYCRLEQHQHKQECYETTLICGHDESEEPIIHIHTTECYVEQRTLVCDFKESEPHIHTDDCVSVEKTLVCENEEPDHQHTDECYNERENSSCTKRRISIRTKTLRWRIAKKDYTA